MESELESLEHRAAVRAWSCRWWHRYQALGWSAWWPGWTADEFLRELADDEQKGFLSPEFAKELRAELMAQKLAGR